MALLVEKLIETTEDDHKEERNKGKKKTRQ